MDFKLLNSLLDELEQVYFNIRKIRLEFESNIKS